MSLEQSGHWYTRDGDPMHEVPDPKNPGEMVNTTLKHARKLQLCPSVTTVQGVQNNMGLNIYRENRCALAGMQLAHKHHLMSEWQWMKMCRAAASVHASDAADAGTQYHLVIEHNNNGEELPDYELTIPEEFFSSFVEWWNEMGLTVVATELGVCSSLGYGGQIDLVAEDVDERIVIGDWKSKETKGKTKSKLFYEDSQPVQLVAYSEAYMSDFAPMERVTPGLLTVIISRDEPGRIEHKYWPEERYETYRSKFGHQLGIWKIDNKYDAGWEE